MNKINFDKANAVHELYDQILNGHINEKILSAYANMFFEAGRKQGLKDYEDLFDAFKRTKIF